MKNPGRSDTFPEALVILCVCVCVHPVQWTGLVSYLIYVQKLEDFHFVPLAFFPGL